MTQALTANFEFHVETQHRGQQTISAGPANEQLTEPGRLPRIAKLMALAIRFETLITENVVNDYADLARLGQVSRARITQIMNLRLLAPDLQEELLFLPRTSSGRDPIHLRQLQQIALTADWSTQRRLWRALKDSSESSR